MKNNTISFALACIFFVCFTNSTAFASNFTQEKDSLWKVVNNTQGKEKLEAYSELIYLYLSTTLTDSITNDFLQLSDAACTEARKQNDMKECGRLMINTAVNLANNKRWKELEAREKEYLDFTAKYELWPYHYALHSNYLENYYLKTGQTDKAISEAKELYKQAKETKNPSGIMTAQFVIARALNSQRRYAEAEKYYEDGLKAYEQEKITPAYLDGWNTYCALLIDTKQWDKAVEKIQEFEAKSEQYYITIDRRYPYLEGAIFRLYAHAFCGKDQLNLAETYLDKADSISSDLIGLTNSHSIRAEIANKQGNYKEALEQLDRVRQLRESKLDYIDITLLQTEALIWSGIEKAPKTYALSEKAFLLADSLAQNNYSQQIDELRSQYEFDKIIAENKIHRQRQIIALSISVLLLGLLMIYFFYSRQLKRKNRQLFIRIQELSQTERKIAECLREHPEEKLSKEMKLFKQLSQYMQQEKAFTDPGLSRKKLADSIHTNESYLAEAIRAGSGQTFSAYISDLRLQHSLFLLENNPEMTLESIAADSGHGSYSPFYRAFIAKYDITPSEYRRLSSSSNSTK